MISARRHPHSQRGNALFIILLAVALFAALNYAVTSSMRGDGKSGDGESSATAASDIINYATLVENETQRLILKEGLSYNQVDYYNNNSHFSVGGTGYGPLKVKNPNCTALTGKQCAIFSENGGGVSSRDFNKYSTMVYASTGNPGPGEAQLFSQFVENVGTTSADTIMIITQLKMGVCDAINTQLGLPKANSQPTIQYYTNGERFYWTDASEYSQRLLGAASAYAGNRTFCVSNNSYGYVFIHVLIAR